MDYIFLFIIVGFHLFLSLRLLKSPLHADSGQFLYRGFFRGRGNKFPLMRAPLEGLGRTLRKIFTPGGVDYGFSVNIYSQKKKDAYLPLCQKIGSYFLADLVARHLKNPKSVRYFLAAYNILNIVTIFYLGRMLFGQLSGLIAAAVFAAYINIPYSDSRQVHAEHFFVLPMMICLLFIFSGVLYAQPLFFLAAGAVSILIVLFKNSAVLEVVFIFLAPMFIGTGFKNSLLVFIGFAVLFFGFLAVLGAKKFLVFYLYLAVSLSNFFDYKKGINYSIHRSAFNLSGKTISSKLKMYGPFAAAVLFLIFGAGYFLLSAGGLFRPAGIAVILWLFFETLSVVLQGKYYFAHFVVLIPPASLMTAAVLAGAVSTGNYAVLTWFAFAAAVSFAAVFKYWFIYNPLEYHLKLYASLHHPHLLSFAAVEGIADYIGRNSGKDDKIKLWGYNSEFYVLAGRRENNGFNEDKVLCDPVQLEGFWGPIWRTWFLRDIVNDPPLYVVDMYGNLNIDFVNDITGLEYRLEKVFYSQYPVYKLLGRNRLSTDKIFSADVSLLDGGRPALSGNNLLIKDAIVSVASMVIKNNFSGAVALTGGGVSEMIKDWYKINSYRND